MPELTPPQRRRAALVLAALAIVWVAPRALVDVWRERPFGITEEKGLTLRDYTSHSRMARTALQGAWADGPSLYSPEAHRQMTSEWAGRPVSVALPFGYSPTMVWVLAPFAPWADPWSYLLWTLAGLALLVWLLWPREGWPVVAGVALVSPLLTWAFLLGQTALYSNAAVLLLALPDCTPERRGSRWRPALDAALLWLLTAKPTVAVMAGGAMLAVGRWRAVALALLLTAASTALAHPLLGPGWAKDYLALARGYNSEEADPTFAWSLEPAYMSNLRAGLYQAGVSDAEACQWVAPAWLAVTALVAVAAWMRWLAPWAAWCLALLAFLVLSPHVNRTEDLHLHAGAVIAGLALRGSRSILDRLLPALFVACCWATTLSILGPGPLWPWPALAGKVALAAAVVVAGHRRRATASSDTPSGG
jgi:hypothetical protein